MAAGEPQAPITGSRGDLQDLRLVTVTSRAESGGRTQPAGAQWRYLAYDGDRVLAALGFGAAAWRLAVRERYIGWTDAERQAHLREVVQNRRFMVLPWVAVRGLASALLGLAARRLPADWLERAGYSPVLLETFVECDRFAGTCLRAANWTRIGETVGRGKRDRIHNRPTTSFKLIWVHPLDPRFRELLCAPDHPAGGRS